MNNNSSRFYHHFMPKTMPYVIVPSVKSSATSNCDDHILNLSASLSKHCPVPNSTTSEDRNFSNRVQHNNTCIKAFHSGDISPSPESLVSTSHSYAESEGSKSPKRTSSSQQFAGKKVDMNCNDVKNKTGEGGFGGDDVENNSVVSENTRFDEDELEQMTEIDVDDSCSSTKDEDTEEEIVLSSKPNNNHMKKSKSLAFGIDRILSFSGDDDKDQKSPPSPSSAASPPVVSTNALSKSPSSADTSKFDNSKYHHQQNHNSILSKLKLCASLPTSENQKRLPLLGGSGLPYFHHSYSPFHHHHHHVNSLITSTSGGGIHNLNSHHHHQQHPLSHCSECVFLRRHGGGGSSITSVGGISNARINSNNIPSSSSSAANNVATNNMQFSSSMATPCGPTSSAISASFTWMANPSVYDSSAIISPVAGYNQHVPLQPSFGMSASGFSTLATMQQCGSGGSSGRRKRSWSRAVFSNLQRKGLEKRFQIQKYITKPDRRQLAATLGLTDAQVKVWFQNRRMKWRHSKEGKVSSGTGECTAATPSSSPVTSTTSSKMDGVMKDKK